MYSVEEFDNAKTKVLKYILFKKRTEKEVRQKFSSSLDENLLDDVIENLKENGYLNDHNYIERAIKEFLAIKTMSIKEMKNKLYTKGLESDMIETYFMEHEEELEQYKISCAKNNTKKSYKCDQEEIKHIRVIVEKP
ncbi:MAG: hypothetical protein ACLR6T_00330 [Intestinibacter sp.]